MTCVTLNQEVAIGSVRIAKFLPRLILFGEGDVAPVTHELLRETEPIASRRPAIQFG